MTKPTIDDLRVLIVEDDPDVLLGCEQALQLEGMQTIGTGSVEEALRRIAEARPGVIVSDVRLPGRDGLSLLREMQAADADLPVILITGHGDVSLAVQAMRSGAYDFIEKPFSPEHLVEVVRRAREKRALTIEVRRLRHKLTDGGRLEGRIIGRSPAMVKLRRVIADIASTNASVLISGDTGTGKELVARCLHDESSRRKGHFVAINCGGLPEHLVESELFGHEAGAFTGATKRRIGKIEHASGGTLFLDEVETTPVSVQIKLLRVLQERTLERLGSNTSVSVDCRIVAAVKGDLGKMAAEGRFRSDLYYRLAVASLALPALRDRREDIPLLFAHFAEQASVVHGRPAPVLDDTRLGTLMAYDWPGNVRELRNVADRCVLGIEAGFPPFAEATAVEPLSLTEAVAAFERAMIVDALGRSGGGLGPTAQLLRIPKSTLYDKMTRLGLADGDRDAQ
ncbi:Fis family transcriptional regulator [Pleomorphomonas diazotrophica]|uniref:Fis family transcriptional regulator n=1 Tax=Pleomorphomonas diazotrophica TaxID=1166257 RepID=A0A1I4QE79_9HYPH|nr:sigma-54 dependent transcriptional regulator [Pleomorphomonas diazotrophica]PKR90723.1 Fis family transcriptional regulator [Pleomorphomonas diazotrophica]SFM38401.1 two-component system, NtrC family, C4-dicarboxylate transport response regulator DctD [Pleomorphomonas diazotrophica]